MAFADRSHFDRSGPDASRTAALMACAGIVLIALLATLGFRFMLPREAVAPAVVTLLFGGGALVAGLALFIRRDRLRLLWIDLAGGLTFVGIAISVFIEPDQLAGLFGAAPRSQ
jgi:hypothetical protein